MAAMGNDSADWDTGTHEDRLAYFSFLHKNKPAEAIALLQQDWGTESLSHKKDFVAIMAAQVQAEDEVLLEAILQQEKEMNLNQVKIALDVGLVLNEIRCELYNASRDNDKIKIEQLKKTLVRWSQRWVQVRKDLNFYYVVSYNDSLFLINHKLCPSL